MKVKKHVMWSCDRDYNHLFVRYYNKIHYKWTIFIQLLTFLILSDRVIDDLNPVLTFSRREVESLLHFVEEEPDLLDSAHLFHPHEDIEPVLRTACMRYPHLITKVTLPQLHTHFHTHKHKYGSLKKKHTVTYKDGKQWGKTDFKKCGLGTEPQCIWTQGLTSPYV